MSLFLPLSEAIALIALPTIITNVWQASVGGHFWHIVRRQWPLILPLTVVLYLTVWLVGQKGPGWAFLVLGTVLIIYSTLGLFRIRLHHPCRSREAAGTHHRRRIGLRGRAWSACRSFR